MKLQWADNLGLVTLGDAHAWAVISPDDRYRYCLGRMWDNYFPDAADEWWKHDPTRPLWVFGMLNPSKARVKDDPTVRKCTGFAKRGGAGGFLVVNMFAFSETHPKNLVAAARYGIDIVGEHNTAAIQWATSRPALLGRNIAAWGKIPPRLRTLSQRSRAEFTLHRGTECLGKNGDGTPCHPLMLSYSRPIVRLADAASS